jgi:plasmid stabilization system protein ParE
MKPRYVLAPEAAFDLVQIWRYIKKQRSGAIADRVEFVIREKIVFLAANPGAGHWRKNLIDEVVKFFPVYSYRSPIAPAPNLCRWLPSSMAAEI